MDKQISILSIIICVLCLGCQQGINYTERSGMMENTVRKGETLRLKHSNSLNRMDIVLLSINTGDEGQAKILSRVIGVPGDVILISGGNVFVNERKLDLPATVKYHYQIELSTVTPEELKDLDADGKDPRGYYDCFIAVEDTGRLFSKYNNEITYRKKTELPLNMRALLNGRNNYGWTLDNFGPVKVPLRGSTMSMDSAGILINHPDEDSNLTYQVNNDYYFVLSDNFHNGIDSRYIGLISKDQIVGKLEDKKRAE